jgi:hypothetical protein
MVKSLVSRFVSSATLVCLASATLSNAALAQTTTTDMHFTTAITEVYGSPYPLTGRLDIQIFPAGNLRGYYHTSYYKLYIPVAGGRDGNYIWFDIGPSSIDLGLGAGPGGKLHVVGTLGSDGSFRGQVYPETAAVLTGTLVVGPTPNPTPNLADQYIFAATPTNEPTPTVSGPP